MTHAARIECFDRSGARVKWESGVSLYYRFPIGVFADGERSLLVTEYVETLPSEIVPEGAHLLSASWSSIAPGGMGCSRAYCLHFMVHGGGKTIHKI